MKERHRQPHKRMQRFILGNPHGGENPTKIPQYRIRPSIVNNPKNNTNNFLSLANLPTLSLAHLLVWEMCPNEGGSSPIYTHQVSDLITHKGWPVTPNKANLPRETQNNIYIMLVWVLLPWLTMDVLPHESYMKNLH